MEDEAAVGAFVCPHVLDDTRPILLVVKEDDSWAFLCGKDDFSDDSGEGCGIVCVDHLIERDITLNDILDLPNNWEAEREYLGAPWQRRRCGQE